MKAKIILAATTDLSYDQRMQRIAETLSSDYEVTLIGRKKKNSIAIQENLAYKVIRLSTVFEKGKAFYMMYNLRLFLYLIFNKADIITATDLDTLVACSWVARIRNIRLGFDAHEWYTELPELNHRPRVKQFWLQIERRFVPGVDFAYTVNHSIAELYRVTYRKDFSIIRNMPYRNDPKLDNSIVRAQSSKIILYQGVLNVGRGLEAMIAAMDHLPGMELHLAGEGDLSESLRILAAKYSHSSRIIFHGYVSPSRLKQLTAGAWIGINLLENISLNYYYSLANKFFDYVQAGIPQITMDFPEYSILNERKEVAILIENISIENIVNAVSFLNDKTHYNELSQNCKSAAIDWCWENESKKLSSIYLDQLSVYSRKNK